MRFFTSDHHFSHHNIIRYCQRPYSSAEEMNEVFIRLWNETISPNDVVYYLGDFSLSKAPVVHITKRLNGRKILVAGNHDRCFRRKNQDTTKHDDLYLQNGWAEIHRELIIELGPTVAKLAHLPYNDHGVADHQNEPRYPADRPTRTTPVLLCGHVHTLWKFKNDMINVGCDVWDFKPVSETILIEFLHSKN